MTRQEPRRLAWDEPAPGDLFDHLGIDDEEEESDA